MKIQKEAKIQRKFSLNQAALKECFNKKSILFTLGVKKKKNYVFF